MIRFQHKQLVSRKLWLALITTVAICGFGCAKKVRLNPTPLAQSGTADARVELTYNRNDAILLKLSRLPQPASVNPKYTCYVVWVATPDRRYVINVGQLRAEQGKAEINTLTPLRKFTLMVTAESTGDVMTPGPDILFQSNEINW
ncbi:MAG: hypothetical protein HYX72_08395 [Acidobacteria bacterium]|nr:hypothetical protein [Acidobacteriota bacterium]